MVFRIKVNCLVLSPFLTKYLVRFFLVTKDVDGLVDDFNSLRKAVANEFVLRPLKQVGDLEINEGVLLLILDDVNAFLSLNQNAVFEKSHRQLKTFLFEPAVARRTARTRRTSFFVSELALKALLALGNFVN